MSKIKIALGDLRHKIAGRHSVFMPIGIGCVASYLLANIPSEIDIRLYTDPDIVLSDIESWKPQIIGLSNYSWNTELSRLVFKYAKDKLKDIICIAGGPEFAMDPVECKTYLLSRPEIDLYIYFEGEYSFAKVVKKIISGVNLDCLKSEPQGGVASIHPESGDLVFGKPVPRLKDLDEIPSPYLMGLMDPLFDGTHSPAIETSRGCPFSCNYCFTGQKWFNHLANFSVARVRDELIYIAKRMRSYPTILLLLCDSNFGMYKRDEEIADCIREVQDKYGWPNTFAITTGKTNYDRILKIAKTLKNQMHVTCSVQSLNPETLAVIKRRNMSLDEYSKISLRMKKDGMNSVAEIISPLPMETKESYFAGLKTVIDVIGVDRIIPYTTILLKDTHLASKRCRAEYNMKTKFRIIPRQFGKYMAEKCFETEEVCISTRTLPFEDYLEIRGFSLVSTFFSGEQFDIVYKHLKELNISIYDFLYHLWSRIKSGESPLSDIYNQFIIETKEELFDSREIIYNYFKQEDNYKKLLSGEMGDNLIRKYTTKLFIEQCIPAIEFVYECIKDFTPMGDSIHMFLDSTKRWVVALRNVAAVFKNKAYDNINEILDLSYDVKAWYADRAGENSFRSYKRPTRYRVSPNSNKLKLIFDEGKKLYGGDISFQIGKLLTTWSMKNFWCQCENISETGGQKII